MQGLSGYPQMLTAEGEGETGKNIIFFCNWKNSFQVVLDAIKKN